MCDIEKLIREYGGSLCCGRLKLDILHAVNMRKIRSRKNVKILSYVRGRQGDFRIVKKVNIGDQVTYYETQVVWNGHRDVMYLFNIGNVERFLVFG